MNKDIRRWSKYTSKLKLRVFNQFMHCKLRVDRFFEQQQQKSFVETTYMSGCQSFTSTICVVHEKN
jgi:hypothetical protein